ncbi:hypothetical protein JQK87_22830 [Streptomyces sp. G44]|uniref:DUF6191 domain-containing protein n=1 Tax=Streptomyces sp. G44 TaxID=2807632 RepID=UPI00196137DE|nr:DUF6191 domain-containing protein [Streptomyces sp. G44]MBM7171185.1 hypothetical protein [Streptomyces sp. G44]
MFNAIEAIFAPGRKHTDDEQKRLEMTRVDLADGDPGRGPIDLSSGKVVVRPPVPAPRADETPDPDEQAVPGDRIAPGEPIAPAEEPSG